MRRSDLSRHFQRGRNTADTEVALIDRQNDAPDVLSAKAPGSRMLINK